jgi:hypothetical protein
MGSPFTAAYRNYAYLAGAAAGVATCIWAREADWSVLAASFFGDLAATVTIYGFGFAANNGCVYDAYWPVAPVPIAAYWLLSSGNRSLAALTGYGLLLGWAGRYLSIEVTAPLAVADPQRIPRARSATRTGATPTSVRRRAGHIGSRASFPST